MTKAQAFVVESRGIAAGLVVKTESGFQFHAAIPSVARLDGRIFHHPDKARFAVTELLTAEDARLRATLAAVERWRQGQAEGVAA